MLHLPFVHQKLRYVTLKHIISFPVGSCRGSFCEEEIDTHYNATNARVSVDEEESI